MGGLQQGVPWAVGRGRKRAKHLVERGRALERVARIVTPRSNSDLGCEWTTLGCEQSAHIGYRLVFGCSGVFFGVVIVCLKQKTAQVSLLIRRCERLNSYSTK